ncbi:MAG: hypothetical protein H7293_12960 [Candidatus Saccharibacteria bacterium]|nr:hypothetical protein [Rhodoferax sp.]
MTNQNEAMLNALQEPLITTDILTTALSSGNLEKGHEAISVMLMQGMDMFGAESAAMQQFCPVWDAIKGHIDRGDAEQALEQSNVWMLQLREVLSIVKHG